MKINKINPIIIIIIYNLIFPNFLIAQERLAVMNLKVKHGVEKSVADALSDEIRTGIYELGVYEVLSKDDLDVLSERVSMLQKVDCEATSQCLIDFGRSIGTKYMVAGSLSKMGETYTITLRLLNTEGKDAGVKQRIGKKCKCNEDQLINFARETAQSLMRAKNQGIAELDKDTFQAESSIDQVNDSKQALEDEEESWFSKYKWWIALGVILVGGGAAAAGGGGGGSDSGGTETPAATEGNYTVTW